MIIVRLTLVLQKHWAVPSELVLLKCLVVDSKGDVKGNFLMQRVIKLRLLPLNFFHAKDVYGRGSK